MVNDKIACVILAIGDKYKKLSTVAANSFKKFHPDIELILINEQNKHEFTSFNNNVPLSALKYMIPYEIMAKKNKSKVIILGSDTITCDYLNEFIENDNDDILATLDYPYQLISEDVMSPDNETHLNSDVVCFNNKEALLDCIKKSFRHKTYGEQGALNEIAWADKKFKVKIVDGPYSETSVLYNVRSKGNICAEPNTKPWSKYTLQYYVKDNKLFTYDHKQIKVFHYCEGYGNLDKNNFLNIMNLWIFNWFNQQTKDFFKNHCNTGTFFEEKYEY